MTLQVLDPGFITSVQDLGRSYARIGVPRGGAMDRFALQAGNLLVGNPAGCAALEFSLAGPTVRAGRDCLVALTGCGFNLAINGQPFPAWMAVFARCGDVIRLAAQENAAGWGYLAVSGGIETPLALGSRSTYLRAGLGEALSRGVTLPTGAQRRDHSMLAGRALPARSQPDYAQHPHIRVIAGPQWQAFTAEGQAVFLSSEYRLTTTADRMAYRLEGAPVTHISAADILSDGIVAGAIQVPASGQPIVMMSDCQTSGGYTKIAAVISADLPVLAQCQPGVSRVRFQQVSVAEAQRLYRLQMRRLAWEIAQLSDENLEYSRF